MREIHLLKICLHTPETQRRQVMKADQIANHTKWTLVHDHWPPLCCCKNPRNPQLCIAFTSEFVTELPIYTSTSWTCTTVLKCFIAAVLARESSLFNRTFRDGMKKPMVFHDNAWYIDSTWWLDTVATDAIFTLLTRILGIAGN